MVWVWLLIIAGILFTLWFSLIDIHLLLRRVKDHDRIFIKFKALFGLFRYKIEIPMIEFKNFHEGVLLKASKGMENQSPKPANNDELNINKEKIVNYYHNVKDVLAHTFAFSQWLSRTLSKIKCTRLEWQTQIGLGDAAQTATTTGIVWALKSSIAAYFFRQIKPATRPRLAVNPSYNHSQFSTEIVCHLKLSLGHAMTAGWLLLIRIVKVKGGIKAWRKSLSRSQLKTE